MGGRTSNAGTRKRSPVVRGSQAKTPKTQTFQRCVCVCVESLKQYHPLLVRVTRKAGSNGTCLSKGGKRSINYYSSSPCARRLLSASMRNGILLHRRFPHLKRTDDKFQLVAFCVNSFCAECAKENFQHGQITCCPMLRGPPAREEKIMAKFNKERTRGVQAWARYILGLYSQYPNRLKWFELRQASFPRCIVHARRTYHTYWI